MNPSRFHLDLFHAGGHRRIQTTATILGTQPLAVHRIKTIVSIDFLDRPIEIKQTYDIQRIVLPSGENRYQYLHMNRTKTLGTTLGIVALVVAIATVILWFRQVNLVALPQDRTWFVILFAAALLFGGAAFAFKTRWFGAIPAVGGVLIALFMVGTIYISPQQVADNPIRVGNTIPQFVALTDQGERFNSNSLQGKPTLLKFFRGHW